MAGRLCLLFFVLLLAGCSASINESHTHYLTQYDWEPKKLLESSTSTLNEPEEMLENYRASGLTFYDSYAGEQAMNYVYALKEKDRDGNNLKVVLVEVDGEIIGGYGVLPNWTPGVFALTEKIRLVEEGKIEEDS